MNNRWKAKISDQLGIAYRPVRVATEGRVYAILNYLAGFTGRPGVQEFSFDEVISEVRYCFKDKDFNKAMLIKALRSLANHKVVEWRVDTGRIKLKHVAHSIRFIEDRELSGSDVKLFKQAHPEVFDERVGHWIKTKKPISKLEGSIMHYLSQCGPLSTKELKRYVGCSRGLLDETCRIMLGYDYINRIETYKGKMRWDAKIRVPRHWLHGWEFCIFLETASCGESKKEATQ